jgi:hypothetical protein
MTCNACNACGQRRATDDDLAALAPECRAHGACSRCEDVPVCWHDSDEDCARALGGWAAVAQGLRAELGRL